MVTWIHSEVVPKVQSFSTWGKFEASGDLSFRAGRRHAEIAWLNCLTESVFGTGYDVALKVAIKAGDQPEAALEKGAFQVVIETIKDNMDRPAPDAEEGASPSPPPGHQTEAEDIEFRFSVPL